MQARVSILVGFLVVVLFVVALAIETTNFLHFASVFFRVPPTSDSQLFLAMGRAWLNGLHFYRDLFETKPPGVFMVAALAMYLGGNFPLYVWFQLFLLVLICPMLGYGAWKCLSRSVGPVRWLVVGTCVVLGLTMAVEALCRTKGFLAEGFGLLFTTVPAILFALPASGRRQGVLDVLAGISLGVAAMFMEPFVASGLLAMLLFCHTRADAWRVLRILACGGVVALAILALSGSFGDYFSLYLPEMLGGRSTGSIMYPHFGLRLYYVLPAPLWLRSLNVYRLFSDLASPAPGVLLALFFGVCLSLWAPLRTNDLRLRAVVFSGAMIGTVLVSSHHLFVLYEMISGLHGLGRDVPWGNPIILWLVALTVGPPLVFVLALSSVPRRFRPSPRFLGYTAVAVLGLVLTAMLVALGGGNYPERYLVFAFPPLLGLATFCLIGLARGRHYLYLGILAVLLVVNAAMPGRFDDNLTMMPILNRALAGRPQQEAASAVDALLASCQVERYFMANNALQPLSAFTMHSPDQITYGRERALGAFDFIAASGSPNPFLAAKLKKDLKDARIILAAPGDDPANPSPAPLPVSEAGDVEPRLLTMDAKPGAVSSRIDVLVAAAMLSDFTKTPPPCARGKLPIPGVQVFFRRD